MSKTDHQDKIEEVVHGLADLHAQSALYLDELRALMTAAPTQSSGCCCCERDRGGNHHPVADHSSLSVVWEGRRCYLGRTLLFRFFERLARRPNQYVTYERLLQDVWDGPRSNEAIRSVVRDLRRKLKGAGMDDLAGAIDGSNRECYGLILDGGR